MDWFLYDNGLRHERVKSIKRLISIEIYSVYCDLVENKTIHPLHVNRLNQT